MFVFAHFFKLGGAFLGACSFSGNWVYRKIGKVQDKKWPSYCIPDLVVLVHLLSQSFKLARGDVGNYSAIGNI